MEFGDKISISFGRKLTICSVLCFLDHPVITVHRDRDRHTRAWAMTDRPVCDVTLEQLPSSPLHWRPLQARNHVSSVLLHFTRAVVRSCWIQTLSPAFSWGHPSAACNT